MTSVNTEIQQSGLCCCIFYRKSVVRSGVGLWVDSISRMRSTVYVGMIGVVAHVPSISHLFQVVECGQVLLFMYRIIECWISVRYFSFFLFYHTR